VRVGVLNVNGDNFDDLIGGAGPGDPPLVRILDPRTGARLNEFLAFNPGDTFGVYVAGGVR
jgi:hypothetical protein